MNSETDDSNRIEWTTNDLAKAAGLSTAYIRQLILRGQLQARKLGRDWVIADHVAKRWLQEREQRDREQQD